jgi:chromosome partitioning protein parB / adenine-specific methyltransferase|nr:MAG TPA: ParB protein [Caudoviricetes sp.]
MIPETLSALAVPIDSLTPYQDNPRCGDLEAIKESLAANGQYRPIVVNRRTGEVLAGNHTLRAAEQLGWTRIAVTWVDVDDETARRIVLVDNRSNDLAGYDDALLASILEDLPDLEGTGYDKAALAELLAGRDDPVALTDPDEAAPLPERAPVSRVGDIWELGESRLLVGDATDEAAVLDALGDDRADCVWTDPPYGVDYVGKTKKALVIQNDTREDLPDLLSGAFRTAVAASRHGAPVYVAYAMREHQLFQDALESAGIIVRQHLVWVKNTMVLSHADYQYRHEPIIYGFTPGGTGRLGRGGPRWCGDNRATTVFEVDKPPANRDHPTMKPVELIDAMLANSLPTGGLVLDLFGGSGSTLIAAHHRRSRAVLVELDPRYADAICRRWQEHTGIVPVRRVSGEAVDFTGGVHDQQG